MGDTGDISVQPFRTPRGRPVSMAIRAGTNDWNTTNACLTEDEYGLRDLHLEGWALDIGAYTGAVTVALAVDNPELQVVAVEPVPDNVELIHRNLALNGIEDRVIVVDAPAGDGSRVNIRYGYSGSELACHHRYVGNMSLLEEPGPENPHTVQAMTSLTIGTLGLVDHGLVGREFSFAKVDCEGCEWNLDLSGVSLIHGEWHPVRGHTQAEYAKRLAATHDVAFTGPVEGPGGFTAVRR